MIISLFPDRVTVSIGLDAETRAIITRILDSQDGTIQQRIDALTARLAASRTRLSEAVTANPDPNTND
jgi:hypothetical protein